MMRVFTLSERRQMAVEEGRAARSLGKAQSACPYKPSKWGLYYFWNSGWEQQKQLEAEGRAAPIPEPLREYET